MTNNLAEAPALRLSIGFTGHRKASGQTLRERLEKVFSLSREAGVRICKAECQTDASTVKSVLDVLCDVFEGATDDYELVILTGLAPGADQDAVHVAEKMNIGVHAIIPYIDPVSPATVGWTDDPNLAGPDLRIDLDATREEFKAVTVLDGASYDSPTGWYGGHLAHADFVVRWSDVLVAVWDGMPAKGPGGTGDAVAIALKSGKPVIWVHADEINGPIRILNTNGYGEMADLGSLPALQQDGEMVYVADASAKILAKLLLPHLCPPNAPVAATSGGTDFREVSKLRLYLEGINSDSASGGKGLGQRLSRVIGGVWPRLYRAFDRGIELSSSSAKTPIFNSNIQAVFEVADGYATSLGNRHRSAQLMLLLIALLAVASGVSPALNPALKPWAVSIELVLLLSAIWVLYSSSFSDSHMLWSDSRRLAERFRAMRCSWPIGIDIAHGSSDAPLSWTEWYARAFLRRLGPIAGVLTAEKRRAHLFQMRNHEDGLFAEQIAYASVTKLRYNRFHHLIELIEKRSLFFLVVVLFSFLFIFFANAIPRPIWVENDMKDVIGSFVLFLSAVVPMISAICLALEAKLGLHENGERAAALRQSFGDLRESMADDAETELSGDALYRNEMRLLLAAELLLRDADSWRDDALRRRLATL